MTTTLVNHDVVIQFQLTRSRGAWLHFASKVVRFCVFQLTRSRGAWLAEFKVDGKTINFNSHAHVERDRKTFKQLKVDIISTHTLTWSVTLSEILPSCRLVISTHTLTWSVTSIVTLSPFLKPFQLTRSRGAWPEAWSLASRPSYFNSHAHVERDARSVPTI